MTDFELADRILYYLDDKSYNYAVLVDGEWGCGKTWYVKNILVKAIDEHEKKRDKKRKTIYISLYGGQSTEEIQDGIVLSIAREAYQRTSGKEIHEPIFATVLKAGTIIKKHFFTEESLGKLAVEWLDFSSYILIFDDLERCGCSINQVFGYINGIVEHDGAKVILIANEKEIREKTIKNKELQYFLALNDDIVWEQENNRSFSRGNRDVDSKKKTIEEIERRRKLLFQNEEVDEEYKKIREKLIGASFTYQPDIKGVILKILQDYNCPLELHNSLMGNIGYFLEEMGSNNHHNLRTFQFFLSKMNYLYRHMQEYEIPKKYADAILTKIVWMTFSACVDFKANLDEKQSGYMTPGLSRLNSIRNFVETGYFSDQVFRDDIAQCIEELTLELLPDDPFRLLQEEYWLHPQKWVEEKLEEILINLGNDGYPVPIYWKILLVFSHVTQMGFPKEYLNRLKAAMIKKIQEFEGTPDICLERALSFYLDEETQGVLRPAIEDIRSQYGLHTAQLRQDTVQNILRDYESDWIQGLNEYTESDPYERSADHAVLSNASAQYWVERIGTASPEERYRFRLWFREAYRQLIREEGKKKDLETLQQIIELLERQEDEDIVASFNLGLLMSDMKDTLEMWQKP